MRLWLVVLILLSIPLAAAAAGTRPPLLPGWKKLTLILQALSEEEQGNLEHAAQLWQRLEPSATVRDHRFAVALWQGQSPKAESKFQHQLQAEYLFWQGDYAALEQFFNAPYPEDINLRLLEARFHLLKGRYFEARWVLESIRATTLEQSEGAYRLAIWLNLLEGKNKAALDRWQRMQEDLLYPDPAILDLSTLSLPLRELERAVLLNPQDLFLLDSLLQQYVEQDKGAELTALLRQKDIKGASGIRQGPLFSQRNPLPWLAAGAAGPKDFEVWAEYYRKQKNGAALKQVGRLYQKRFPQLRDGAWYIALAQEMSPWAIGTQ